MSCAKEIGNRTSQLVLENNPCPLLDTLLLVFFTKNLLKNKKPGIKLILLSITDALRRYYQDSSVLI